MSEVTGISLGVSLAVLGAAVLHASWNGLIKSVPDQLVGFTQLQLAGGVMAVVLAAAVPAPSVDAWPFLATSVVLHTAYQSFLLNSYRVGEFSQVYPIARGTAPLVVALLAIPLADERLSGWQLVGVLAVTAGLISLAQLRTWMAAGRPPALWLAVATGLVIAAYTIIDGLGVRRSDSAIGYAAWLMLLDGVPIPLYVWSRHRARLSSDWRAIWRRAVLAGALSLAAYGIVLWAQTRAALGPVAALRETGVIVGALIGSFVFDERFGRRRTIAAVLVAAGAAVLNLA